MSISKVTEFFESMERNAELKKSALALFDKHFKETEKSFREKIVALGKSAGFDFSADDLEKFFIQNAECSDDELRHASGGSGLPTPAAAGRQILFFGKKFGR